MWMANGYGLALLTRVLGGNFQLMAHGGNFLNIVEERHVAEGAGHTGVLRRVVGEGCGSGAAVDEEELVIAKDGHEFGHQLRIGCGERALMIVDAGGKGDGVEH